MIPSFHSFIAQFRIITNNFDAEYGNYSGGQINVVTKSGSNQYHGTVFDFLRQHRSGCKKLRFSLPLYYSDQFGGTVGGPIRKNKEIRVADDPGMRVFPGATQSYPVPSDANRTGDLSDSADSLTGTLAGAGWANTLSQTLGYPVTQGEIMISEAAYRHGATGILPNAVTSPTACDSLLR